MGLTYLQVSFPEALTFVPQDQLEALATSGSDPLRDLSDGRYSACSDLRRTLVHFRYTGRLADLLYSMETTDTTFYAYQFKPVVRLLQSRSWATRSPS